MTFEQPFQPLEGGDDPRGDADSGPELDRYDTTSGVWATNPVDGSHDIPDDVLNAVLMDIVDGLTEDGEAMATPATVEDFRALHNAVRSTLETNPDRRVDTGFAGVTTNEWPSQEENLPPEAQRLLAAVPIATDTELVGYKVRHQVSGTPSMQRIAEVQFLRVEHGPEMLRRTHVTYAVEVGEPNAVERGEIPSYLGVRDVNVGTWRETAPGQFHFVPDEYRDAVDALRTAYTLDQTEFEEVIAHTLRTIPEHPDTPHD